MIFMLLKVAGLDHLPEHVLNDWALEPSQIWQAGDESPSGEPYADTGFNLTLPNHESWVDALVHLEGFLEDKTEMFHELIGIGAEMQLHVGVSILTGDTVSPPLEFSRPLLADLVSREINLSILVFEPEEKT